jgi:hypothetical protein
MSDKNSGKLHRTERLERADAQYRRKMAEEHAQFNRLIAEYRSITVEDDRSHRARQRIIDLTLKRLAAAQRETGKALRNFLSTQAHRGGRKSV